MSKANKVQKVYIEATRDTLTPAKIARDLGCSVDIVKKHLQDNPDGNTKEIKVEEPIPKGETRVSAMMKLNSAQKTKGVTVMTGAVSEVVDDNRKTAKAPPFRSDCVIKIRKDKPVSN